MFGLACSKFGLKISGTCSRRSKFDSPKFEEFEVRFFDVRSKTSIVLVYILLLLSRNKFRELRMRGKLILNVSTQVFW